MDTLAGLNQMPGGTYLPYRPFETATGLAGLDVTQQSVSPSCGKGTKSPGTG